MTEKELRETYLPAFEACIREGGAASIMSAYSGFNGKPDTGNHWLLTDLLRKEWGFHGAVVGDVDSVADLWEHQLDAKDAAEASAMAIKAGNDLCSGTTYQALGEALQRGLVTESDVDGAAIRLFSLRFRLGMFDSVDPHGYQKLGKADIDTPAHENLALRTAEESLVLLKNDGVLPLNPNRVRRVAILGPAAADVRVLEGNYNGTPGRPSTLLKGIREKLESMGIQVAYDEGAPFTYSSISPREFPAGTLFTSGDLSTPGLVGEVFGNPRLEGDPIAKRTDREFNFHWGGANAFENIPSTNCSVRWTGVIVWPKSETIDLRLFADDGVRLYLDGQRVLDEWRDQPETAFTVAHAFIAGQPVKVTIEFYQAGGPPPSGSGIRVPRRRWWITARRRSWPAKPI